MGEVDEAARRKSGRPAFGRPRGEAFGTESDPQLELQANVGKRTFSGARIFGPRAKSVRVVARGGRSSSKKDDAKSEGGPLRRRNMSDGALSNCLLPRPFITPSPESTAAARGLREAQGSGLAHLLG
ncbi:hypothetical protein MRX96_007521 [Rhipicephalus microplus]